MQEFSPQSQDPSAPCPLTRAAWDRTDSIVLVVLVAVSILYSYRRVDFVHPPFEDAAMLVRYARNWADGYGIVWNRGERPVDGATDFLFMAMIAGLVKIGCEATAAARGLSAACHLLSVAFIYVVVRLLSRCGRALGTFAALWLLFGPGLAYADQAFGTPVFALSAAVTYVLAMCAARHPTSRRCAAFAISALILGLIRPEGVLLSVLVLLAMLLKTEGKRRALAWFVAVFGILGTAYFAWRWTYFGHPLPNPFYVKGGGRLHIDGLRTSVEFVRALVGPFWLLPLCAICFRRQLREAIIALLPIAGFAGVWLFLSDEMNWMGRFQYAAMTIAIISFLALVPGLKEELRRFQLDQVAAYTRVCVLALLTLAGVRALRAQEATLSRPHRSDGRADIGKQLRQFRDKGYWLALTEAGLLPFYSEWNALDAGGLNDPVVAHTGRVTPEHLNRHPPEIIMFHVAQDEKRRFTGQSRFRELGRALDDYATTHRYRLAAMYGMTPFDVHYYYVRCECPDADSIIDIIQNTPYQWYADGGACRDWRSWFPSAAAAAP